MTCSRRAFLAQAAAVAAGQTREVLHQDDFSAALNRWVAELEKGGKVEAAGGRLVIDAPGGCTLWFKHELAGPVVIEYQATMIRRGGPNDRVSDLNCFWMATNPRSPGDLLGIKRSGKFGDYDQLRTYYVGLAATTIRRRGFDATSASRIFDRFCPNMT